MGSGNPTPGGGGKGGFPRGPSQNAQNAAPQYASSMFAAPVTQAGPPSQLPPFQAEPFGAALSSQSYQPPPAFQPPQQYMDFLRQHFGPGQGSSQGPLQGPLQGLMALNRGVQGSGGYNSPYGATTPGPAPQLGAMLAGYFDQFRNPK